MKIFLKTEDEIELMRRANRLVADTLAEVAKHIKPGVTTLQLDNIAEAFIRDHGGVPSFKNCPNPFGGPFPASICTSINRVVVHGIPSAKVFLKEGDIISVDCGAVLDGFNGDSCYTFCVGEVDKDVRQLLKTTKESLAGASSWRYRLGGPEPCAALRLWRGSRAYRAWYRTGDARGSSGS